MKEVRRIIRITAVGLALGLIYFLFFDNENSMYSHYLRTILFGMLAIVYFLDFFSEHEKKVSNLFLAIVYTFLLLIDITIYV
ncbi:hypothetical protein MK805_06490 [Shimazuella sp. AN120528]|uniref:hypothetical protein n=1 Tax=Shimazuella soli TaxID=1892854 RepID=UPI001F10731A|nr:hypothetical protein [Shimazuella soli]MCH5584616.1 hypothetical protein [Shimazuella soli]